MDRVNEKISDFVPLPRKIGHALSSGQLSFSEFQVLVWIFIHANPYNGFYLLSYEGLRSEMHQTVSIDNARKIVSSLRKKKYIYYHFHKGRPGAFPVYPIGLKLVCGKIQTEDNILEKTARGNPSQGESQVTELGNHKQEPDYHKLQTDRNRLIDKFSGNLPSPKITPPYNDIENEMETNKIIEQKTTKDMNSLGVKTFSPRSSKEEQCHEIAKSLGEPDMRFMLSCLRKYGLPKIESVWGKIKETPPGKIRDPRKYFNTLMGQT